MKTLIRIDRLHLTVIHISEVIYFNVRPKTIQEKENEKKIAHMWLKNDHTKHDLTSLISLKYLDSHVKKERN